MNIGNKMVTISKLERSFLKYCYDNKFGFSYCKDPYIRSEYDDELIDMGFKSKKQIANILDNLRNKGIMANFGDGSGRWYVTAQAVKEVARLLSQDEYYQPDLFDDTPEDDIWAEIDPENDKDEDLENDEEDCCQNDKDEVDALDYAKEAFEKAQEAFKFAMQAFDAAIKCM